MGLTWKYNGRAGTFQPAEEYVTEEYHDCEECGSENTRKLRGIIVCQTDSISFPLVRELLGRLRHDMEKTFGVVNHCKECDDLEILEEHNINSGEFDKKLGKKIPDYLEENYKKLP